MAAPGGVRSTSRGACVLDVGCATATAVELGEPAGSAAPRSADAAGAENACSARIPIQMARGSGNRGAAG